MHGEKHVLSIKGPLAAWLVYRTHRMPILRATYPCGSHWDAQLQPRIQQALIRAWGSKDDKFRWCFQPALAPDEASSCLMVPLAFHPGREPRTSPVVVSYPLSVAQPKPLTMQFDEVDASQLAPRAYLRLMDEKISTIEGALENVKSQRQTLILSCLPPLPPADATPAARPPPAIPAVEPMNARQRRSQKRVGKLRVYLHDKAFRGKERRAALRARFVGDSLSDVCFFAF